jgi:antitoxin component of RelBE/YafQ-DinJ toxin-antitoxin module
MASRHPQRQRGLNLTDAVTAFLHQSVAVGGLPFPMRRPSPAPPFDWSQPGMVKIDQDTGQTVLPAEWDADQDSVYDSL